MPRSLPALPRALVLALLAVTRLAAQSPDDCASAVSIPLGVTPFSTLSATTDGPSPCALLGGDVWFTFEAPAGSIYRFALCANTTYDAALAIHDGAAPCPPAPTDLLGCDDDACAGAGPPIVELALASAQVVRLQVGGYNGALGVGEISITDIGSLGVGDLCSDAQPISTGATPYTTLGLGTDGPPACAQIGTDRWFDFTAPTEGTWRISLCVNTGYDAAMAIYPASAPCPPASGDAIGCNDDGCGGGGPPILQIALLAGETVRLQVGGWNGASGDGEIFIEEVPPLPAGANIVVGNLFGMSQFGRLGDEVGCSIASTTCNQGAEPLDWYGNPDPRHPFITTAAYRLHEGRFEQIGLSWVKHGFAAAQTDACNFGCTPHVNGTRLGSGCSDIYGAGTNAAQGNLGPRSEIDPFTGDYDYSLSILSQPSPAFDPTERRLILKDPDIDPSLRPGASYFAEVYVLGHDDLEHADSLAWEPIGITGSPGGTWSFDDSGGATVGAAIHAWPGATVVEARDPTGLDGRVYAASRVTELGGGAWRYDYAIQNLDLTGGIGSFTLPVEEGIILTDITFHAPEQREPGYDDEPWSFDPIPGFPRWSTDPAASATPQNPLRWGAMYSFGFTADRPPMDALAILGVHEPVGSIDLSLLLPVPEPVLPEAPLFVRGDTNQDGSIDIADAIASLTCLFSCLPVCLSAEDCNDDGVWDIADPVALLGHLFLGTGSLPPPFPACGVDPTPDGLDCSLPPLCP
ncbi:MAG: hypothetical protein ACO4B4_10365 [Planctomycetota bacterium]|jgi:hypothetical protein